MGCGASNQKSIKSAPQSKYEPTVKATDAEKAESLERKLGPTYSARRDSNPTRESAAIRESDVRKVFKFGDKPFAKKRDRCLVTNIVTGKIRQCKRVPKKRVSSTAIQNEIRIMNLLDHPNLLQLFDVFDDKAYYYLIEQTCQGGLLIDFFMSDEMNWSEECVVHVVRQVLTAVNFMHGKCVCHRDLDFQHLSIKEGPILSQAKRAEGGEGILFENCTIVVEDFRLACEFQPGQPMTDDIASEGRMQYLAPEVEYGSYTELCDLWTCGVCTYTLLCGKPPFEADTDDQILHQVLHAVDHGVQFNAAEWDHVSNAAKELVRGLLVLEEERCTARRALNYPWLTQKECHDDRSPEVRMEALLNMKKFREGNLLKQKAMRMIANRMRDHEISGLAKTFVELDKNKDGVLTLEDFADQLGKCGSADAKTKELADKALQYLNESGRRCIDYTEFLAAALDERHGWQDDLCWQAFTQFDKNGDRRICKKEFEEILGNGDMKDFLADGELQNFFKELNAAWLESDTDGDGEIDFVEFKKLLCGDSMDVERARARELSTCSKCGQLRRVRKADGDSPHFLCSACWMRLIPNRRSK